MLKHIVIIIVMLFSCEVTAQSISREDYSRAVSFLWSNLRNKKVFNNSIEPEWLPDSSGFFYATSDKNGRTYFLSGMNNRPAKKLFDQDRLARILSDSLKISISANDLPLGNLRFLSNKQVEFNARGKTWLLNTETYSLGQKPNEKTNETERKSPDGNWIAYGNQYNLFIKSAKTGAVKQLSTAGKKNYEYASYYPWGEIIEGENGVRPPHFDVTWSPDSKWIMTYLCDLRTGKKMYLLDWSIDSLYRAKLLSYYRGSPGDTDMVYMTPVFFNIESGEEILKEEFRNVNQADCEWSREPGVSYLIDRKRGYQQVDMYRLDLHKKSQKLLYTEKSPTNIDNFRYQLDEPRETIIITSERDGWRQLYALNLKDQKLKPLTAGSWYVNDIYFVDKKKGTILFSASGKEHDSNPYAQKFYKINADGTGLTLLTAEIGDHDIFISPDGKYFTDNISSYDNPTTTVFRESASGKILKQIAKADVSALLEMNYHFPEKFTATARDGVTTIYGMIWKPSNFTASRKYPVIDQSYTGPHTHMFPETFSSSIGRSNQALAELGFIVVAVDGMGTAGRSKSFHNISYKNMGKNLLDHVLAIRQLGRQYGWIDTVRVGIFGHSAGGYDAGHALLEFPDFYQVGVASSADHDFRMEKDWWPEMYMGWPVDSTYQAVSNITMAGNLKGKLMIVHGGIDENVNPSATFKLAEALVKADKEFDMLIFPSQHHAYQGKFNDYFLKKRWNYFVEHLLGQKPIWDFPLK